MVGVHASMRNGRPIKSPQLRRLEEENRKLKEVVLNPVTHNHQPKKRDEFGLGQGRLLEEQKRQIIKFVNEQKTKGYTVTDTLKDMGIKRSTYYFWIAPKKERTAKNRITDLAPYEKATIEEVKEEYPHIILIDFFSRYVISYGIFPSINASHVKHIYRIGLKERKDKESA